MPGLERPPAVAVAQGCHRTTGSSASTSGSRHRGLLASCTRGTGRFRRPKGLLRRNAHLEAEPRLMGRSYPALGGSRVVVMRGRHPAGPPTAASIRSGSVPHGRGSTTGSPYRRASAASHLPNCHFARASVRRSSSVRPSPYLARARTFARIASSSGSTRKTPRTRCDRARSRSRGRSHKEGKIASPSISAGVWVSTWFAATISIAGDITSPTAISASRRRSGGSPHMFGVLTKKYSASVHSGSVTLLYSRAKCIQWGLAAYGGKEIGWVS